MMIKDLNALAGPSREDWRFPLVSRFKSRFRDWMIAFCAAALLITAALYGLYLYKGPAPVVDTKPAVAVGAVTPSAPTILPTPTKRFTPKPAPKIAINIIADKAINTSDIGEKLTTMTPPVITRPLTPAEQDFANRLALFESKIP
jgi:hypothetical protein